MGVQKLHEVACQLEVHGLGKETCEQVLNVPFIMGPPWPEIDAHWCYGNPRCTGFSCITGGYGKETHGAWAKQTIDIHQLCEYGAGKYDVVVWESVQQAYSTGRELLDYLIKDVFAPKGYRIAHLFLNAMSFGNVQTRKRYFFVAYRGNNFNVEPPEISPFYKVVYDDLWALRNEETNEWDPRPRINDYSANSYIRLSDSEKVCVPHLPNGWDLNSLAKYNPDILPSKYKFTWDTRASQMPFSLHCISRLNWLRPCPVIHGTAQRYIHPMHNRPLTIRELSVMMGWGDKLPKGPLPVAQIAKGICPEVGTWLARQVELCMYGSWGKDDWESTYNSKTGEWKGKDTAGQLEKVFDLTDYVGHHFDKDNYDESTHIQQHRHRVECGDNRFAMPWREKRKS